MFRRVNLIQLTLVLGVFGLVTLGSSLTAKADLVRRDDVVLSGQGVGAVITVLSLQSPANSSRESGGVLADGTAFGDFSPPSGPPKNQTFTLATVGALNASELGLIVNLGEPNSEDPASVIATDANGGFRITLQAWSSSADGTPTSFVLESNQVLEVDESGVGGSGLVFGLDAAQAAALDAFIAANPNYVLSVWATFEDAQGNIDIIQAARIEPIPEPATMLLLGSGLLGVAATLRKRFTRK
jgi:hypothetical protein